VYLRSNYEEEEEKMKKLIMAGTLVLLSVAMSLAQTNDEKAILQLIEDYDKAYLNYDLTFVERVWADKYLISTETGEKADRAKSLEQIRKEKEDPAPKYKMLSYASKNDFLHVTGNTAVVSGTWKGGSVPSNQLDSEPHIDTGRYTMFLEKRRGKWLVVAEHFSESPHDRKMMEAAILKRASEYNNLITKGEVAAIEQFLDDDYLYTDDNGVVRNKAEDLANYKNRQSKIESSETLDQKIRIIGNSAAVETATFRVTGKDKEGKSFVENERYTTTWVWRNGNWKIIADHTSKISQ
jgi:ketosteroid isomerase-like protein